MSDIFGGNNTGGSEGPSSYDISQNQAFNDAIANVNATIAGSSVNLAPLIARLDSHDLDITDIGLQMLTKVDKTVYDAKMAENQAYFDSVDSTFNLIYDSIAPITAEQTTQNNRLTALEGNIASGYVTNADLYVYQTTQNIIDTSQDSKIDDLYARLGGSGGTVDLGPLNTRVTAIEAEQITQNQAINTKATVAYVDFKSGLLQTNIDDKVPLDAYTADLLNTIGRLSAVESTSASNTSTINGKVNTTTYNAGLISQGGVDLAQNNRLTAIEGTLGNFSTTASRINVTQPEGNLQAWLDADVVVTEGQNLDIGTLQAKVSILEDAVINNPPTIAISQVTDLQTNLTSLQNQITTDVNSLATHKTTTGAHTAVNISNTPIANLTQLGGNNVQSALTALGAKVDQITVNSTGFTSFGTTLLTNWYGAANVLAIPSNMFMPNFVSNDEISTAITGNRGSVIWNINQGLNRISNVGFKSLRLGSKFVGGSGTTAAGSSDTLRTTWDFSIASNLSADTTANYFRINPWRMSFYSPYGIQNNVWSVRGPQTSTDNTTYMVVANGMTLTDTAGSYFKTFESIVSDLALHTTGISTLNINVTALTGTVNSFNSAIATNTTNISTNTTQISALNSLIETNAAALANTLNTKVVNCEAISMKPVINNSGDLSGLNFSITQQGPAAESTEIVFGVSNRGAVYQKNGFVIGSDSTIFGKQYNIGSNVVIDTNANGRFNQLTVGSNFSYNGSTWITDGGQSFLDSSRNVNGRDVRCVRLINNLGQTLVSSSGEIISNQTITCNNNVGTNTAFSVYDIIGNLTTKIQNDGTASIGGLIHDPSTFSLGIRGSFGYPMVISSNNSIDNNGTTSEDIVLGKNNQLLGGLTGFLGQKRRVVVGYNNKMTETRSVVCGSNNSFDEFKDGRTVCILGNNWFSSDIWANDAQVAQQGHYILLGQGSDLTNAACFVTIGNGLRIPTSSSGFPLYARAPDSGVTTIPTAQHSVTLTKGASARKYKKDINLIPTGTFTIDDMPEPVVYRLKETNDLETGVIADDVKGPWEGFVYKINGEPEAYDYARSVVGLYDIIRQQDQRIKNLENMMREFLKLE